MYVGVAQTIVKLEQGFLKRCCAKVNVKYVQFVHEFDCCQMGGKEWLIIVFVCCSASLESVRVVNRARTVKQKVIKCQG